VISLGESCSNSTIFYDRMPTIGRVIEVGKVLEVCTSYRGPPCTITSPNVRPPGCEILSDRFERLNACRMHLMRQVTPPPPSLPSL